ncbi:MAG: outer membrane protein assembly factor, partial [Tannerella sp.]|nr:outer membrane protein assembly factor [Tannerella sp.]
MKKTIRCLLLAGYAICIASCTATKYVGENEYLLDRVKITADSAQVKPGDLKPYLRQAPNYKVFGLVKWPLYVYNLAGQSETGWLNRQLRRIGEPPVVMDTLLIARSKREFKQYMINKGYLHAEVTATVDTSRRRKATVKYHVVAGRSHRIRDYRMVTDDARIDSLIHLAPPRRSRFRSLFRPVADEYVSQVHPGALFDRDELNRERQRIATVLQNHGYYAFNQNFIHFAVDSANHPWLVDLELRINPFRHVADDGTVVERPHRTYYVDRVNAVTDYDPLLAGDSIFTLTDSAVYKDLHIYYGKNGRSLRPGVLQYRNHITAGKLYSEADVKRTYSNFSAMRALRYVNIRHEEFEENDTMKITSTIITTPAKVHGFGVEVEGTNSAGDLGFASSLNYQHRNLFKGSELFAVKVRGAYEALSGQNDAGIGSYWEYAGEASVLFPTLLIPFAGSEFGKRQNATTRLEIVYNQQRRPEYRRAILSGGWSYLWQNQTGLPARHTLKLLDINYIYLPNIDQAFKDSLPLLTTLYNYSDQFIVGSGYSYSFSNYDPLRRGRNTYSLRIAFESAGNILYGVSSLLRADRNSAGRYELFGINYSQFVKGDIDFARHFVIDERNSVAFHIGGGIGYPYGNAKELPFERRYFAGGANNNRGWSIRSLGPGSMSTGNMTFVNQVGDIRMDASLEYRSKLFWKFELATYVDAGNIWTIRPYDYQPKGH